MFERTLALARVSCLPFQAVTSSAVIFERTSALARVSCLPSKLSVFTLSKAAS